MFRLIVYVLYYKGRNKDSQQKNSYLLSFLWLPLVPNGTVMTLVQAEPRTNILVHIETVVPDRYQVAYKDCPSIQLITGQWISHLLGFASLVPYALYESPYPKLMGVWLSRETTGEPSFMCSVVWPVYTTIWKSLSVSIEASAPIVTGKHPLT